MHIIYHIYIYIMGYISGQLQMDFSMEAIPVNFSEQRDPFSAAIPVLLEDGPGLSIQGDHSLKPW